MIAKMKHDIRLTGIASSVVQKSLKSPNTDDGMSVSFCFTNVDPKTRRWRGFLERTCRIVMSLAVTCSGVAVACNIT